MRERRACRLVEKAHCISTFLRGMPKLAEDAQRVGKGRRAALDSIVNVLYDAPQSLGSIFIELAMPPVTCSFSKTMTMMNLSGCFEKAYGRPRERPAAPAPTILMATRRWVFVFVVGRSHVIRSKQLKREKKGIQILRSNGAIVAWAHNKQNTERTRTDAALKNIIISNHNKSACVRPINPQSSGILQWSRDFLRKILSE